mgnify:CR=1 FL=1
MPDDFEINGKDNLITLCDYHHVGKGMGALLLDLRCVHPDTEKARIAYSSGDLQAFSKMMGCRKTKNNQGIPYWNTLFDLMFTRRVAKANRDYISRCTDDVYPYKRNGHR